MVNMNVKGEDENVNGANFLRVLRVAKNLGHVLIPK